MRQQGFDKGTINLISDAWRSGTKKVYTTYLRKWSTFCLLRGLDPLKPTLPEACRFLRTLSDQGLGYAALNTARCSLSTILPSYDGRSFGSHPYVCWLVKGGYERNPPKPRYSHFWDVNCVFKMLKDWGVNRELSLKRLSLKLAVLLLLTTSQRGQTIVNLSLKDLELGDPVIFRLQVLLKHNRLGDRLDSITLKAFELCKRLCVVRTLKEYLVRTEGLRGGQKQLLISFVRPHGAISRDTLGRWTLLVLRLAGIDTSRYKSHSTRGAAASAAKRIGVPLNLILKQASWKCEESFARHYDKQIEPAPNAVGHAILAEALR